MRKTGVFIYLSVDGFYAGPHGEIDWFKPISKDEAYEVFTHKAASMGSNLLVFGRTTYEIMASFWPTPEALESDPEMAKVVNDSPKIVFSKTLKKAEEGPHWKNIRLLNDIKPEEIIKLKNQEDKDMTILGSGSIVQQFANLGLIDEYQLAIYPVILGAGKRLFKDVKNKDLKLLEAKSFNNGIVILRYQPRR